MSEIVYVNENYEPHYIVREAADGQSMIVRPLSKHIAGFWINANEVRHTGRYL